MVEGLKGGEEKEEGDHNNERQERARVGCGKLGVVSAQNLRKRSDWEQVERERSRRACPVRRKGVWCV